MDDFYVYYVIDEENPSIGKIHAIAPHEVKEMADMSFIRIPADYGLQFTFWSSKTLRGNRHMKALASLLECDNHFRIFFYVRNLKKHRYKWNSDRCCNL